MKRSSLLKNIYLSFQSVEIYNNVQESAFLITRASKNKKFPKLVWTNSDKFGLVSITHFRLQTPWNILHVSPRSFCSVFNSCEPN